MRNGWKSIPVRNCMQEGHLNWGWWSNFPGNDYASIPFYCDFVQYKSLSLLLQHHFPSICNAIETTWILRYCLYPVSRLKETEKEWGASALLLRFSFVPRTVYYMIQYVHEWANPKTPASCVGLRAFCFLRLGKRACHAPKTKIPASTSLRRGLCAQDWIRTSTPRGAATWRRCVYQFRHLGNFWSEGFWAFALPFPTGGQI